MALANIIEDILLWQTLWKEMLKVADSRQIHMYLLHMAAPVAHEQ